MVAGVRREWEVGRRLWGVCAWGGIEGCLWEGERLRGVWEAERASGEKWGRCSGWAWRWYGREGDEGGCAFRAEGGVNYLLVILFVDSSGHVGYASCLLEQNDVTTELFRLSLPSSFLSFAAPRPASQILSLSASGTSYVGLEPKPPFRSPVHTPLTRLSTQLPGPHPQPHSTSSALIKAYANLDRTFSDYGRCFPTLPS